MVNVSQDPQSVFTPIVQKMKEDDSNWSLNIAAQPMTAARTASQPASTRRLWSNDQRPNR